MERMIFFNKFDLKGFWSGSDFAKKEYQSEQLTADEISKVEEELGYTLPRSYIEFMSFQNGGVPLKNCFPTTTHTSWASDHIKISGFLGVGSIKENSICGEMGQNLIIKEWGYPNIGVYICDCPSGGHDIIMLDYSNVNGNKEPRIVHIDQEMGYKVTVLADNFKSFIEGLVSEEEFI